MKKETDIEQAKRAEMYQRGMSREKAKGILRARLRECGGAIMLTNENDGDEARLNMASVSKMMSVPAVKHSVDNGFTREQHFAVASDIENLYRGALKVWSYPDMDGNADITAMHRLIVPLYMGNAVAYITVKESADYGKKIYTVEIMEIKRLEDVLNDARERSQTSQPSSSESCPATTAKQGDRPSFATPGLEIPEGPRGARQDGLSPPLTSTRFYDSNIRCLLEKVNT